MISSLRKGDPTTQTFWGCDDTDTGGVLGVFVDGALTTGDTLAAADNYTGLVTVTGLSGSHSFQMALDGVAVGDTYTFETHPVAGEDFDLLLIGDALKPENVIDQITTREGQARAIFGAECSYIEGVISGEPADGTKAVLDTASNATEYNEYLDWYRASYRQIWSYARWHKFANTFPGRYIWNNHEFDSNKTDNGTGVLSTEGECQFDAAVKAYREYEGNGLPSATDDTHTVDTMPDPVIYFSEVIGDLEIICLDETSYNEAPTDYQLDHTSRGSQAQKAWLETVVAASTAKCIIIWLPSNMGKGSAAGIDEWEGGVSGLLANGLQVNKPIIILSANTHVPQAHGIKRAAMARPIAEINVSPLKQTSRAATTHNGADNPDDWAKHAFIASTSAHPSDVIDVHNDKEGVDWMYCLVQRRNDRTTIQLKNPVTGSIKFDYTITDDLVETFSTRKTAVAG